MTEQGARSEAPRPMRVWLFLWLLAAAVVVIPRPAGAQFGAESGRVLNMSGRVSVERAGELWALMPAQEVKAGEALVTGPDGHAQMELPDRSTIEVFPNSRLIFRANRFNWRDLLDLYFGKVRLYIQHLSNEAQPYRVSSPTAVISIRGTVLEVEVDASQETRIYVEAGTVGVRHRLLPGKEVTVETGQSLRVLPTVPLAAAKMTSPLVIVGRIAKVAVEAVGQVRRPGTSSAPGGGSAPVPTTTTAPRPSGSDAGSNEPAPVPGQDGTGAPPGDAIP